MFWTFIAALTTGVVGFASGLIMSRCGICCPPERPKNQEPILSQTGSPTSYPLMHNTNRDTLVPQYPPPLNYS